MSSLVGPLSKFIDIIGGGTPKRSEKKYWNGTIPWISIDDLNNLVRYIEVSKETITELGLEKSSTKLLKKGTIIISARGTVGKIAQLKKNMAFNQSCYGLLPNKNYLTNDYLFYLTKHHIKKLISLSHGTSFRTIIKSTFDHIIVNLPSIDKQNEVTEILGSLDEKIEINLNINKTLEEFVKNLFICLFIKFQYLENSFTKNNILSDEIFKLFSKDFENSSLGKIPKDWGLISLDKIFTIKGGTQPPAKYFSDTPKKNYIRLLQIRDFSSNDHKTYIPYSEKLNFVTEDDILVGRYGSGNGNFEEDSLGRPLRGIEGAINVAIAKIIAVRKYSKEYANYFLKTGLFYKHIVGSSARAVQAGFRKEDLEKILVPNPTDEVLKFFDSFANLIWERQKNLNKENIILQELRDNILSKLFSERI